MKILLISYYFPPYNSVGAIRPSKFAEYLHEKGHDVHVISSKNQAIIKGLPTTFPLEQVTYCDGWSINTPIEFFFGGRSAVAKKGFQLERKNYFFETLGRIYKTLTYWPDSQQGWVKAAFKCGSRLLDSKNFDLIYVSGPPFSGFRVAEKLSKFKKLPWIAEYRDLWTDNHNHVSPYLKKCIEKSWESKILSTASALVTVSQPLKTKLLSRFSMPVWEIRNGYDAKDYKNLPRVSGFEDRKKINIVFTGNIYSEHYDLKTFCRGLKKFKSLGGGIKVHLVGRNINSLVQMAEDYDLIDLFSIDSTVERPIAMAMQKSADILLTFIWDSGKVEGIYTTKLFEYIGAGKPIMAIGSKRSDIGKIINEYGFGMVCSSSEEVMDYLKIFFDESQKKKLKINSKRQEFARHKQFFILEKNLKSLLMKSSRFKK